MTALTLIRTASPETPIALRSLARQTGMGERAAKAEVQRLRREGHRIVALRGRRHGYYIELGSSSEAEERLKREALSRFRTLRGMSGRAARELLGQMRMEAR